jgi:hypothetical protein
MKLRNLLAIFCLLLFAVAAFADGFEQLDFINWYNFGSCSAVTVGNALSGQQMQWAYLQSNFSSSWIIFNTNDTWPKIRFRASNTTTSAQVELIAVANGDDGEYVMDVNLPADSNAQPATMSGYYYGNLIDTNDANSLAPPIGKQNCDTNHRMGVLIIGRQSNWKFLIVHVKQISGSGTIYWDKAGY